MMTRRRFQCEASGWQPGFGQIGNAAKFMVIIVLASVFLPVNSISAQDRLTSQQIRAIKAIGKSIDRAGKLYQNKKLDASAKLVKEAADDLQRLVSKQPSAVLLNAVRPEHQRLIQAREALATAGQTMAAIPALPDPAIDPNAPVSFKGEVASILNQNCGRCHVQGTRGQFSMANYNALMEGVGGAPVVVPSKDDESRLIEVIEEGSMPPNGTVPDAAVARLKKWIAEGAKYDAEDPTAGLAQLAQANGATPRPANIPVQRPTGTETVSFSLDIAPVLIDNCTGCHFEARNARGGLRIDTFRQFLRGGDSGPMINPGDGANSTLVKRLTATNRREQMPLGRPALKKEVIEKVIKWIDEGARFDGRTARMNLREVSSIAASEVASHDDLMGQRHESAKRNWNKVMSNADSDLKIGRDVFVIGSKGNETLDDLLDFADGVSKKLKSEMKMDRKKPLVKGQIALFLFDRRYDYSEFGKMIETRDLPKDWKSHWGYTTVDAYSAILGGSNELSDLKPELNQRLAAIAASSLGKDVPSWFSDGYGYVLTEQTLDNQKVLQQWQERSTELVAQMQNATDFLQGRLPDDDSGLIAYGFVRFLREAGPKEFDKFVELLGEGRDFNEAFAEIWSVPPVEMIRQMTGQRRGNRGNNRRRNRRNRGP